VRLHGEPEFGTKVEVKNLNSFRFLKMALDYEVTRQVGIIESGGTIHQETRLFNPDTGETAGMRSKEQAHDYRYFPEPDLVPLRISAEWQAEICKTLPELPASRRARFVGTFGLRLYDAEVLTQTRAISDYFDRTAAVSGDPRSAANWVMGDLSAALKAANLEFDASPVSPEGLGELISLIASGEISGKLAKDIFPKMFASGDTARAIVDREGLRQISDAGALARIVDDVIAASPKQVEQYRSGKTTVIGYLVGQVMKASRGQANPQTVNDLLKEKLG
jgi:aspartyl-tRNA(Asn)/glutamyl-tRNA(Gln) amidotransferase subunit B